MEELEDKGIGVYIRINDIGMIQEVNSEIFIKDFSNWIKIDEGFGDKYAHAQGNYFPKSIYNDNGTHTYILEDNIIRETTKEEQQAELDAMPKPEPSAESDLLNMAVDHEYRLTVLELGV